MLPNILDWYASPQSSALKTLLIDDFCLRRWYSFELPSTKVFSLAQWIPYQPGSKQYEWFSSEIAAVNRTQFPWLLVQYHGRVRLRAVRFRLGSALVQRFQCQFRQFVAAGPTPRYAVA